MPKPTKAQLKKINNFTQNDLKEEQVYTFTSLSADTLPIRRFGWFGEYSISLAETMLEKLKQDYRKGVGLLASHDKNRLPFGRTYDANVSVDTVDDTQVKTLYIEQYMVKYMEDEDGNKTPLRTEINNMTTEDIANHIDAGHAFDTSIGFSMDKVCCSICKNDLRDWENCSHSPGRFYDVQVGDKTEKVRCNVIAESGEGIENSIVYAGAVNRAIIKNEKESQGESLSQQNYAGNVNTGVQELYNVEDLKNVPLHATFTCSLTKTAGNMEILANTSERRDYESYLKTKESENMSDTTKPAGNEANLTATVSQSIYDELKLSYDEAQTKLSNTTDELAKAAATNSELKEELAAKDATITELSAKAALGDEYKVALKNDVVEAAIAARGNALNVERFTKYVESLGIEDLKEELSALKEEATGAIAEARVTAQEQELNRSDDTPVEGKTLAELRQEASLWAALDTQRNGGDVLAKTQEKLSELRKTYNV